MIIVIIVIVVKTVLVIVIVPIAELFDCHQQLKTHDSVTVKVVVATNMFPCSTCLALFAPKRHSYLELNRPLPLLCTVLTNPV